MISRNLEQGIVDYRVTFALPDSGAPSVTAMRYVGVNLFPNDNCSSTTYYFEEPNPELSGASEQYFTEQDLGEVRDLRGVVDLLESLVTNV